MSHDENSHDITNDAKEEMIRGIAANPRAGDGSPSRFYSVHPSLSSDIEERGIDLLSPVWHILDLTPQGRGEWVADLGYGTNVAERH